MYIQRQYHVWKQIEEHKQRQQYSDCQGGKLWQANGWMPWIRYFPIHDTVKTKQLCAQDKQSHQIPQKATVDSNTLQHNAIHYTATHCNTLQHTNALQHTATHCNTLEREMIVKSGTFVSTHGSTLQHTRTHGPTNFLLQHAATRWIRGHFVPTGKVMIFFLEKYSSHLCNRSFSATAPSLR